MNFASTYMGVTEGEGDRNVPTASWGSNRHLTVGQRGVVWRLR